ncbi:unnamed protein product [Ostreobium quekettii]|uniref:Uncharacterized protein n=1 Tax=Ostreobium quekettii TaxID=121088 RepID=A0A8S1JH72_9CHLO|nr:unnamed protein product [Ostreobium quekettii]
MELPAQAEKHAPQHRQPQLGPGQCHISGEWDRPASTAGRRAQLFRVGWRSASMGSCWAAVCIADSCRPRSKSAMGDPTGARSLARFLSDALGAKLESASAGRWWFDGGRGRH